MASRSTALRSAVVAWFRVNGRDFPWRRISDPFQILVAEVLLRQTQASRVAEPYCRLVAQYPNAAAMAKADVKKLRAWFKPLGLVTRADRLIQTAQILVESYGGQVPNDFEAVMALPGMGAYSARAVLCLSFGKRLPMIDEGSGRVVARLLDIKLSGPAYSAGSLMKTAERLLPTKNARQFNLGLIDIAAAYCRPAKPACSRCPVAGLCLSAQKMG